MQNLSCLLKEITELTNTIESDRPEHYRYLDENPISLPRHTQSWVKSASGLFGKPTGIVGPSFGNS